MKNYAFDNSRRMVAWLYSFPVGILTSRVEFGDNNMASTTVLTNSSEPSSWSLVTAEPRTFSTNLTVPAAPEPVAAMGAVTGAVTGLGAGVSPTKAVSPAWSR